MVKALEKDNSNVRVARLSQSEHEYGSFPSFEEIIPMEPSPMLRIPDINVALAPESESELDIYGVQIYEEPLELTEKPDEIDKTPKHNSFQQDDKFNVEVRSQSKEHEANDEHVCKHYTLLHITLFSHFSIHYGIISQICYCVRSDNLIVNPLKKVKLHQN